MSVGGIDSSAGGSTAPLAELSPRQAMATAQVGLLDTMLDVAMQLNAQLLEALEAGSPSGVGSGVDTYA